MGDGVSVTGSSGANGIVKLNIGGKKFVTTAATLLSCGSSCTPIYNKLINSNSTKNCWPASCVQISTTPLPSQIAFPPLNI